MAAPPRPTAQIQRAAKKEVSVKKLVASLALGVGMIGGFVAVSSPAWAACGLGVDVPTSSMVTDGSRTDCGGTVTLRVRTAKDVPFSFDPYHQSTYYNFGNGTAKDYGNCNNGAGSYYGWVLSSTGNEIESGRVGRC